MYGVSTCVSYKGKFTTKYIFKKKYGLCFLFPVVDSSTLIQQSNILPWRDYVDWRGAFKVFFLLRYCVKISDNKWWNNWLCWGYPVKMVLKNTSEKLNSNVSLQISWPGDSRQSSSYFFQPSDAHQPTSPHRRKPASSHRQETHAKDIHNSGILLSCALRLARLISLMS